MIQAQEFDRGYPPVQGRFHFPGKRHADWPIARKAFPHVAVVPVTHAPREFRAGDPEGFESRDETPHTPIITHRRVGATQKCQNGEKIMTRHTLGMEWNRENFGRLVKAYCREHRITQAQFATDVLGIGSQYLANILAGQRKLGSKKAKLAATILNWPNPFFAEQPKLEVDESLLRSVVMAVEEVYGPSLPTVSKSTLIARIYNLVLTSHTGLMPPSKDKILDLVRSLAG